MGSAIGDDCNAEGELPTLRVAEGPASPASVDGFDDGVAINMAGWPDNRELTPTAPLDVGTSVLKVEVADAAADSDKPDDEDCEVLPASAEALVLNCGIKRSCGRG